MEQITIEKKLYLTVGIILTLMLTTVDVSNIGLNKTVGFAYDITTLGKSLCLISLCISFIAYFILAILGYKTSKEFAILYVLIAFVSVDLLIFREYPMIVLILSLTSIIVSTINIIKSISQGKEKTSS